MNNDNKTNEQLMKEVIKTLHPVQNAVLRERMLMSAKVSFSSLVNNPDMWRNPIISLWLYIETFETTIKILSLDSDEDNMFITFIEEFKHYVRAFDKDIKGKTKRAKKSYLTRALNSIDATLLIIKEDDKQKHRVATLEAKYDAIQFIRCVDFNIKPIKK